MDGNKDEAERCLGLAEQYILEGKRDKAEKFLLKSEKLYSTQKAKDLLESLRHLNKHATNTNKQENQSAKKTQSNMRKEKPTTEIDYTKDQLDAVKRVKTCKDYYEILGVTKEATDSDIKKAYKKLALSLHPDKNKAPGSAEAFKAIGNAVAILTDVEKRKQYDHFGSNETSRNQNYAENYTRGFESDVTAEELFNMFFGGAFPGTGNVYVRTGNRWVRPEYSSHARSQQSQHGETANYSVLMQMLPVLIIIGLSMMSSFIVSDPIFSLTQTSKFPVLRTTMALKVPYYVKENFHNTYQGSIKRLEMAVEADYVEGLRNSCYRERTYRESLLWRARNFADNNLFEKAKAIKTPSCDTLSDLNSRGP